MAGEHQTTGDFAGEEKTFPFVNFWGQRITMREKTIPLTLEVKGEKITKPYTFVFSPGGWELWREKKKYLIEGLQKALPKVEEAGIPVRVICVLLDSDASEDAKDPREGDLCYSIVIGLELVREIPSRRVIAEKMEDTFRAWRDSDLMTRDMELAKKLVIMAGYGWLNNLLPMIGHCL